MNFDPDNPVIKLCAEGINMEGAGNGEEALKLFKTAWDIAANDLEKFTSAHYLARQQKSVEEKLEWDMTALKYALKISDESVKSIYPSLYLNIAKGHEDLADFQNAKHYYEIALSFTSSLSQDGYGSMIRRGIVNGLERLNMSGQNN